MQEIIKIKKAEKLIFILKYLFWPLFCRCLSAVPGRANQ
jgi:hypothetical protein